MLSEGDYVSILSRVVLLLILTGPSPLLSKYVFLNGPNMMSSAAEDIMPTPTLVTA